MESDRSLPVRRFCCEILTEPDPRLGLFLDADDFISSGHSIDRIYSTTLFDIVLYSDSNCISAIVCILNNEYAFSPRDRGPSSLGLRPGVG